MYVYCTDQNPDASGRSFAYPHPDQNPNEDPDASDSSLTHQNSDTYIRRRTPGTDGIIG